MQSRTLLLLSLVVPSVLLSGSAVAATRTPSNPPATGTAAAPALNVGETATPAGLVFGDVDGDGLDDAFVVGAEGQARLLMNFGGGRFEDITRASNLAELGGASCALFADFDGDGRADLFTGSSETRLWKNLGNATFEPMPSGIEHDLVDLAAEAVDLDLDGRLDLQIHTEAGDLVYRNLGEARFERLELPLGASTELAPSPHVGWIAPESVDTTDSLAAPDAGTPAERRLGRWAQGRALSSGPSPTGSANARVAPPAPTSSTAPMVSIGFDSLYVNDNMNEVGSADIANGSLTGADVSTSSGNVTFAGATVTALKGVFGSGSSASGSNATVSGGYGNSAPGATSTVSGGYYNTAVGTHSTVSGGRYNAASGLDTTVSGGSYNTASYFATTVSGGQSNTASGFISTVSGGSANTASGDLSTVPGGTGNTASANFSFAAGRRAKANHVGSFVWGDSAFADKPSSAIDQFNVYAEGGMRVFAVGQTTPSLAVEPAGNLTVRHNVNQGIRLIGTTNDISPAEIYFDKTVAGATHHAAVGYATNRGLFAWVNGGDRLNVLTNGNVGIGTTAPAFTLEVNGTAGKPGGGSWSVSSDRRLKKNVADLEGALETLLALRGVTFEYIDPAAAHELSGTRIGFIAQEVEEVLPDWVEESGGYKRLTVRGFEALAVEAFRTQEEKIETLSSESRQQRDEIASLRSRVTELESLQSEIDMLKTSLAALAAR